MIGLEDPPTKRIFSIAELPKTGLKRILMDPSKNEFEPPRGLRIRESFRRIGMLNPAVIQHRNPSKITLFPRIIYYDGVEFGKPVKYSCITRQDAFIENGEVHLVDNEEVVFQSELPHGDRGIEDFRLVKLKGERPIHGVAVYYDGFNARTAYLRTKGNKPYDFSNWHRFGVFFPNILSKKAINSVGIERYVEAWEANYGEKTIAESKAKEPNRVFPKKIYLATKDCCPFPEKVEKDFGEGPKKYYAILTRFLPDMQVVYVKSFEELARKDFWKHVIGDLESYVMMKREQPWEESHIGLGGSPIPINGNYLISYHGAKMNGGRDYRAGEALVSREDPQTILERTKNPVLFATEEWEENGVEPGKIVFPTGYVRNKGLIYCFYGAGDKYVAYVTKPEQEILKPFHS